MNNILITGGAGSGGSYLAEYIVKNHPEVKVHILSRWHSTTSHNNLLNIQDKIIIHECDMSDLASLIRVLREIKPTKIFNMASHANVRVCFDTPIAVFNNNVSLMANLLEAIRLECPNTILQQCSTSEVYGTPEITPITEKHPLNPVNPYAASKLSQEALCWAYCKSWGLKIIMTRAFAYINPRRREIFTTAFALQIARIEAGKQDVLKHGNLDSLRQLMDVRDMAHAYWLASEKCEYGVPYNICGNDIIPVGGFLDVLIKHAKCYIPTEQDPLLLRPIDMTKQVADNNKFNSLTNFKVSYTLDESIEFLLNHVRENV